MRRNYWTTLFFYFSACFNFLSAFNVDTDFPIIQKGSENSYFGYSVALHKNSRGYMLLVGAPRANSSYDRISYQPGAIFRCPLQDLFPCEEIRLDSKGDEIQRGGDYNFQELRNNSWLGVSLDTSNDNQSSVLACGHRWKDKQYSQLYPSNGICYTVNAELDTSSVKALRPLVHERKQLIDKIYFYALGMAGISAQYLSDGSGLMMGAPGVYDLTGTIVAQLKSDETFSPRRGVQWPYRIPFPDTAKLDINSYFGYSVTSGKFYKDGLLTYVAGAPRDGLVGRVYVFRLNKELDGTVVNNDVLYSHDMGDYFGATVCAVDLNNDKLDDLLVGSPFFSVDGDEGAVIVYISDGHSLEQAPRRLTGSTTRESRFGSSISPIGDLNHDGYTDVAIGAPYEGNGAVYIYLGSSEGIQPMYSQRILASVLNKSLRGFGISLSRGKDIDDNNYSDLAVGAYDSSHAVVLRTYPIVKVFGGINFDVVNIKADEKNCDLNGVKVSCFQVETLIRFEGTDAANQLEMEISVDADTLRQSDKQSGRVHFNVNGAMWSTYNYTTTLKKGELMRTTHKVYIKENVMDFLTPVRFRMSYEVRKSARNTEFCKQCPVLDPSASISDENEILFATNCGDDEVCRSDLELTAKMDNFSPDVAWVIGSHENINVKFELRNSGDPAFQSTISVSYPDEVDLNRVPAECSETTNAQKTIVCNMGNPLEVNQVGLLELGFSLGRITNTLRNLRFNATAKTASEESPDKLHDNTVVIDVPFVAVADIHVRGLSVPDQALYNQSFIVPQRLSHIYEIENVEPSKVDSVTIEVSFPQTTPDRVLFLNEITVRSLFGQKEVLCSPVETAPTDPNMVIYDHPDQGKVAVVDCGSMICYRFVCMLGPFMKGVVAKINITAVVDVRSLLNITNEANIEFTSWAQITINDDIENIQPEHHKPDKAKITTTIFPIGITPQSKGVATWIIVVAVLAGLLLLLAIILLLFKCGFFKRTQKDEMEKMMFSGEISSDGDNHLLTDENESS